MQGRTSAAKATIRVAMPLAAILSLSACEGGFQLPGATATDGTAAATTIQLVETDVEAPEIFQVTDQGLWDGRPSLGGVWVAHPDVTDPERVIIRNEENGTFVIGALFRRERENPGPLIQVSSDAAEALQMLAGAPARLNVTALRREEIESAAPAETAETAAAPLDPDAPTEEMAPPDDIDVTPLDPVAGAAAAIDAAEAAGVPGTTTAPAPVASDLTRPYIQLGIFSIEGNARELAEDMQAKGLASRVVAQESQGRSFWRVLVGPATTEAQRQIWLDQVKSEGFTDAYFVAN
jgi:rare lipoprotein A